jgi:ADP-ribose pyrophosphatase YjhB (NUDIX family)
MDKPRVGSALLIADGTRILLGRRGKQPQFGKWVLPGGGIRLFEPIDDAARREALEETGLIIDVYRRAGVYEIINEPDEHRIVIYSEARPVGGELVPGSDLLDVKWFERHELDRLDLTPLVRLVLQTTGWLPESVDALGQVG